jgi:hypothetical protein
LLIYWWKNEIGERLLALSDQSGWARRLASVRKGFWSYPATVVGAAYLVWAAVFKWIVQRLSGFESGRRTLAVLVRRQGEQELPLEAEERENSIPALVREGLLEPGGGALDSVASDQLESLLLSMRLAPGLGYPVLAERGGGKTTFLLRLCERLGDEMRSMVCPTGGYEAFEAALAAAFGLPAGSDLAEELPQAIRAAGVRVLGIDDAHLLVRPYMGGQRELDRFAALDARLEGCVSWVLMIDRSAWRYILLGRGERALFQEVIELPSWTEDQLGELVQARCRAAGIDPDYTQFVLPRQLDTGEYDRLEDRNRFGHARILWEMADGNPEVAIRLFADSLRRGPDGRATVLLPQARLSAALSAAGVGTLLVLRVVVQCDVASVDDVARSLRISTGRALASVHFCLQNGWLERVDGGFRLTWEWYPTITRQLERRNLMPR